MLRSKVYSCTACRRARAQRWSRQALHWRWNRARSGSGATATTALRTSRFTCHLQLRQVAARAAETRRSRCQRGDVDRAGRAAAGDLVGLRCVPARESGEPRVRARPGPPAAQAAVFGARAGSASDGRRPLRPPADVRRWCDATQALASATARSALPGPICVGRWRASSGAQGHRRRRCAWLSGSLPHSRRSMISARLGRGRDRGDAALGGDQRQREHADAAARLRRIAVARQRRPPRQHRPRRRCDAAAGAGLCSLLPAWLRRVSGTLWPSGGWNSQKPLSRPGSAPSEMASNPSALDGCRGRW